MELFIEARSRRISLLLKDQGKELDKMSWEDENNLSLSLLNNLDKILERNKIQIMDLEKSSVNIENAGLSTGRMLKAVSRTVNYCLTE